MAAASSKKAKTEAPDLLALCFEIIAEQGWSGFAFDRLATKAGMTLAEIRKAFSGRPAILDRLSLRLDEAMLAVDAGELADLPERDRVFELVMSRLEAMAPLRAGIIRLMRDARFEPELTLISACRLDRSITWLQEAAGLGASGLRKRWQRRVLTGLYLKTLQSWSDDDSADLAKTMASLDKDLRRIEAIAFLKSEQR